MSKSSKKSRPPREVVRTMPRDLLDGLAEASRLMERRQSLAARGVLEGLDQRYPDTPDVLTLLVNATLDLQDMPAHLTAYRRLDARRPNDPDVTAGLAGAYLVNASLGLAHRIFRRLLERWPNHPRAAGAREAMDDLERMIREEAPQLGLADDDDLFELVALHDEVRYLLEHQQFGPAQAIAEQALKRRPTFVPVLNNLSQIQGFLGRFDQAIATAQRVLARLPNNHQALGNLCRFLVLTGQTNQAGEMAARLMAVTADAIDLHAKQAEALSFLGDDAGVLAAYALAERADREHGHAEPVAVQPLLTHLAAVAHLRLGREAEARRLWQRTLELAPGFSLAQANLDDLRRPVEERHAPWPYAIEYWLAPRVLADLRAEMASLRGRDADGAVDRAMRRFLRQHPGVTALAPALLDRGDPLGRLLALQIARAQPTPALLAALQDFALSQRGPDAQRQEAAIQLREAGLLPVTPVRLWLRGAWQEIQLQKIEIVTGAMTPPLPGRAQDLLEQGMLALRRRDGLTAERVLTEALALAPGTLSVRNNLAAAYELQGRRAESLAILRALHAEDPDYPFARATLAGIAVQEGRLDEAEALLKPLFGKSRYHASEFAALAKTQISLLLARGNRAEAERLLAAWAEADPDHPEVAEQRQRLAALAAWATASKPTVAAPVVAPPATRPLRLISRRRPGQ